jgi:predicted  nucleic acid-binding Zn-ribbon protein
MARAVFTLLLAALIFIPYALGEGFSSFTDDGRLKITLYYPAEVKSGTCFTLVFQTTFLGSVTVDRLRLTVTYVSGSGSTTLLTDTLVSTLTGFVAGNVISKTYSICLPSAVSGDPVVSATVYANYTRETLFQPLTHSWHLSIVRSRTYDEVASSLAQAESLINSLRQTIEGLRNEINTLKAQLERALRENTALSTRLEEAGREIERIGARYANLSAEYRALNERYIAVVGDLRSLQSLHQSLQQEHAALSDNYRQLLDDYRRLTNDYTALQARYTQLQSLYENLSARHDDARRQIGLLQSQLEETRASLQNLQQQYSLLSGENSLHRNIAYAQGLALAGVASALATVAATRRGRKTAYRTAPALPPPPPPPPEETGKTGS